MHGNVVEPPITDILNSEYQSFIYFWTNRSSVDGNENNLWNADISIFRQETFSDSRDF